MQNFESTYALLVRSEEKKAQRAGDSGLRPLHPLRGVFDLAVRASIGRVPARPGDERIRWRDRNTAKLISFAERWAL